MFLSPGHIVYTYSDIDVNKIEYGVCVEVLPSKRYRIQKISRKVNEQKQMVPDIDDKWNDYIIISDKGHYLRKRYKLYEG